MPDADELLPKANLVCELRRVMEERSLTRTAAARLLRYFPAPGEVMKRDSVVSTAISSIGYDRSSSTLEVEFVSGEVYRYFDVPETAYRAFLDAGSKGTFFHDEIRDRFRFSRVPAEGRAARPPSADSPSSARRRPSPARR